MVPLIMSALIGIGVKIAGDLLSSGVKKTFAPNAPAGQSTFSALLDRARGTTAASGTAATAATPPAKLLAAADQVPVRMTDATTSAPSFGRAYGAASYQRMDIEAP